MFKWALVYFITFIFFMGKTFFLLFMIRNSNCYKLGGLDYGSSGFVLVNTKVFAITTLDVYKTTNPFWFLILLYFLMHLITENVSKRKGSLVSNICLAFC